MIVGIVIMLGLFAIFLIVLCMYQERTTERLLDKHQAEWDAIVATSPRDADLSKLYIQYVESLPRHWLCGYCYPRF